ncbi:MAG: NAD(+)/NADH kinase [Desulfovibrio sp.]|nr:NAD(+)/NADH kinase [Desulfovibrio sp.]
MATAGLIVNPASGKDIRRLVSHGSVFDNQEKVRITRRLLMGLETAGVTRVLYMPDSYTLVLNALESARTEMAVEPVEMPITNSQVDSILAAELMERAGVDVILVLGGDGTSRAVHKGARSTPLLSISTGTNNVFPAMMEATVAGLAAGVVASRRFSLERTCCRASTLDVCIDGRPTDIALVDVAVYDDIFQASRAVWDLDKVPQLFLSRCKSDVIGLSSIGGQLASIKPEEPRGLALDICPPALGIPVVTAAIAPGLFVKIGIQRQAEMLPGQDHPVSLSPCLLAVDGEREIEVNEGDRASVRLNTQGVWVVNVPDVMELARKTGFFVA